MMRLLVALSLAIAAAAIAPPAGATMTCDPVAAAVCTGDSGDDPYAACDGTWADAWALGNAYAQVCDGYDGTTHIYVCPLAGDWMSPNCQHVTL